MFLSYRAKNDPLNDFRLSNVGRGTYFWFWFQTFFVGGFVLVPNRPGIASMGFRVKRKSINPENLVSCPLG